MAKRTITTVEMTDDLSGGKADRTVPFAFDGTSYEIDLSKRNIASLEKALKPYVDVARKARATAARRRPAGGPKRDVGAVREWARSHGYEVSDRGRIPTAVLEAYDAG